MYGNVLKFLGLDKAKFAPTGEEVKVVKAEEEDIGPPTAKLQKID